jgi:hypothetical protein
MSYFRSYFEKNNTIIKDSQANTAKNPTTEIFYGSAFSKFLFKVDFTDLKNKVNSGELVVDSNTRHTLHLTNTIFGDEGQKGLNRTTGRDRTSSFDLIVFGLGQYWDEGLGYDYTDSSYDFVNGNRTFDERPSNWFYRTTLNQWPVAGVFHDSPTIISGYTGNKIHMDNGGENIDFDITPYVNGIISGDTNHGLGLSFAVVYQYLTPDRDQSVAFFTKYTQTFFEPYVDSHFEDTIMDNRDNFIEKIEQNLYLYVTKGTNFYNLDSTPTVDILDSNGSVITGLSGLTTTLIRKGVYKVTFTITTPECDGKKFFTDHWKGVILDGNTISGGVRQKFIPKPYTAGFTIGENQTELQRYAIQFFGIKQNEKIVSGEIRKVVVTFKSIDVPKTVLLDEVYYRIYIEEGTTQVMVHDWTLLDKTNENSFQLDSSYLIPRQYFLQIKGKTHTEEIYYKESINFEIVSEK